MIGKSVLNSVYSTNLNISLIICLDSEKLFSEPKAISLKPRNETCNGEKWSEQPTSASQCNLAYNDKVIESYLANKFWVCEDLKSQVQFGYQNQRNSIENYGDIFEEQKSVQHGYNKEMSTIKMMTSTPKAYSDSDASSDDDNNPLVSKTIEEVLQSQALSNAVRQGPNFGRSKRRLYHLRQDVIVKIIFRCMRKHYMKDFKAFFDFSKCNSDSNSDTNGELVRQINRYLEAKFGDISFENMAIYFISIIDIKEKFISISDRHRELKENISGLLYCYNKPKLLNLIKNPQFALLLFNFLNKQDILRLVIKSKSDAEVIRTYSEQIQTLKWQCSMSLRL